MVYYAIIISIAGLLIAFFIASYVIGRKKNKNEKLPEQDKIEPLSITKDLISEQPKNAAQLIRTWLVDKSQSGCMEYTAIQKAAIFFITVGIEYSSMIFQYMREDEIETVVFEITRIESVGYNQKCAILNEFNELMEAGNLVSNGGIEYARELLEKSLGCQKAIDILNRLTSGLQIRPFDFIRRADPSYLINFIQQEHPQIIALILSHLEPSKASKILENLPHEVQSDVARRIAIMDRTSPETLREIERVLERKLSTLSSEDYATVGGVESIVEILNLVDRASEKQIIESLEDEDPELAEEIKKRMFVFEDIIMLDDQAVQKFMREVDTPELAKALKTVDSEVQNKIFNNMSKSAAASLREDIEHMGPVRLKDIEEVQQKIVSIIRHLEDEGEIVILRAGEDELV